MSKLVVGLTGGIASGKSTVAALFKKLGIEVIHADQIAKSLTEKGQPLFNQILTHFGPNFLTTSGDLDRRKLRQSIFKQLSEKRWLEALLHPEIRRILLERIAKAPGPYLIVEIPLLLENRPYPGIDRVLVVDAEETHQIARAELRDQLPSAEIQAVMQQQLSRSERLALAEDVIHNDGDLVSLERQVRDLDRQYRSCELWGSSIVET